MSLKVVRNLKPLFGGFARTRVITHPWSTANFDAFARLLDKFELALGSLTFPEKLDEKRFLAEAYPQVFRDFTTFSLSLLFLTARTNFHLLRPLGACAGAQLLKRRPRVSSSSRYCRSGGVKKQGGLVWVT